VAAGGLVAGLALLPQGVVTGVGLGLGKRVVARWGTRLSALLGLAILAFGTAALLLLTATTPARGRRPSCARAALPWA